MTEFKPHPTETIPESEMAAVQTVVEKQMTIVRGAQDPRKRGQHPKTTALVQGIFEVERDLPDALRVGLFRQSKKFDALVRLSTGQNPNDHEPNTHAMAVKVLNADGSGQGNEVGGCQDFITLAYPNFFIQTAEQYAEMFSEALTDPATPNFWSKHPEFVRNLPAHMKVVNYHLEQQYWGQTPIAFGEKAIRFTIRPHVNNLSGLPKVTTPDGLRDALVDQLSIKQHTARYDFCVQLQIDEATMPVEDPTMPWASPSFKVASLTIPAQEFMGEDQFELAENIAYDPWTCLPEHQPLGSVQRCRKLVYEASRSSRQKENDVADFKLTRDKLKVLGANFEKAAA